MNNSSKEVTIFGGVVKSSYIDYPEKISMVLFTNGCNFACPYCHNRNFVKDTSRNLMITNKMALDLIKSRVDIIDAVVISGGEPTLHKEHLVKFLRDLSEIDVKVKLDTNGTNPSLLMYLLDYNLIDYVAMDVKTCVSKYLSVSKCKDLKIADIKKSIRLIKESGIDYEFRTTVVNELHSLEDIVDLVDIFNIPTNKYFLQEYKNSDFQLDQEANFSSPDFIDEVKRKYPLIKIRK